MPSQSNYPTGVWLPLITPFRDGELDEDSLRNLVRHYLNTAIDGFILAATTGEGMTIDRAETEKIVSICAGENTKRLPIFLGLSGSDTRKLLAEITSTEDWPIDGYLITCPYYTRPAQRGLVAHFTAAAGSTVKPVMIYNIPYRTGVNILNPAMLELAALPNIVGVKDCCVQPQQTFELIRDRPESFSVLTGEDLNLYSALTCGADGAIMATAHVLTEQFCSVYELAAQGEMSEALRLWRQLTGIAKLMFTEPSPSPIKHWLWREGLIASPEVRLPMVGVSDELAGRIDTTMKELAT